MVPCLGGEGGGPTFWGSSEDELRPRMQKGSVLAEQFLGRGTWVLGPEVPWRESTGQGGARA